MAGEKVSGDDFGARIGMHIRLKSVWKSVWREQS